MTIKCTITDCTKHEGVYRAVIHFDGIKYSKDYTKHEYDCLSREDIHYELKCEVIKLLPNRIIIERSKGSL